MGTKGYSRSRRFRFTIANVRIIGAAEGSIIATIISDHIRNNGTTAAMDQGAKSGPDIFIPAQQQMPVRVMAFASRSR